MRLIGKIKKDVKLSKKQFYILQALMISKYEYQRIFKDFIDNNYALIVDDQEKHEDMDLTLHLLNLEDKNEKNMNSAELNYKLNTDFFIFYYLSPEDFNNNLELNDNIDSNLDVKTKLNEFFKIIPLLRIDKGYITNKLVSVYK